MEVTGLRIGVSGDPLVLAVVLPVLLDVDGPPDAFAELPISPGFLGYLMVDGDDSARIVLTEPPLEGAGVWVFGEELEDVFDQLHGLGESLRQPCGAVLLLFVVVPPAEPQRFVGETVIGEGIL